MATPLQHFASHETTYKNLAVNTDASLRRISEIILPSSLGYTTLLLPVIAQLTQHNADRWLTWIVDKAPAKAVLQAYGANLNRLRLIHIPESVDNRWVIWEALAQGNSHTVVAQLDQLSEDDVKAMEQAGSKGNTQGVIIRAR